MDDWLGGTAIPHFSQSSFLLYSVGWNEVDDGGTVAMNNDQPPSPDWTRDDWVWRYPAE